MKTSAAPTSSQTDSQDQPRLLLGVDGGGSKTAALVASLDDSGQLHVLGRGRGGPSNFDSAGKQQSLALRSA